MVSYLERWLDDNQPATICLYTESLNQRIRTHACYPNNSGGVHLRLAVTVLERDAFFSDAYNSSVGVNFDPEFLQCVLDVLSNFFSHSRHQSICHFNDHNPRFTAQRAPLYSVAQQVSHFGS